MGLFSKKKSEVIPEVTSSSHQARPLMTSGRPQSPAPSTAAPSYRSTAPSYQGPSQGGQGYGQSNYYGRPDSQRVAQHQPDAMAPPPAARSKGWFGTGGRGDDDKARNELLGGANMTHQQQQQQQGSSYGTRNNYGDQPHHRYGDNQDQEAGELDEDEEVEGIKQQMRFVKQESLASTRNAVRIAREAEETARATLDKLGEQSDRLANTERHLDLAKAHNDRAVDETKELEALNRSIFRPNFNFNKASKRDKEERRILARHNQEKDAREQTRREQFESRQRIDQAYQNMDRQAENSNAARLRARARGAERQRYQFEATASDDEVEDEIDNNLDEMSNVVGRLKMLATTAGQEVDAQNQKLGKLGNKVDVLDNNVVRSTQRLARVK
ncbi:Protein transport protein S9 plasma membrane t-SNARE [Microbotryomycetes sp. JL221]|nr:Protein transport protein S9 plasma membrane t-SNARE [Microbotryomycetes sp. JL221]